MPLDCVQILLYGTCGSLEHQKLKFTQIINFILFWLGHELVHVFYINDICCMTKITKINK